MARGVTMVFLQSLQDGREHAIGRGVFAGGMWLALFVPAWLLLPDWGIATHAVAGVVGAGLGWLVEGGRLRGWTHGLRQDWRGWMRASYEGADVTDIAARKAGRPSARGGRAAGALVAFAALEGGLALWAFTGTGLAERLPLLVWHGAVPAWFLARQVRLGRWCYHLQASLDDMRRRGELGAWGVR